MAVEKAGTLAFAGDGVLYGLVVFEQIVGETAQQRGVARGVAAADAIDGHQFLSETLAQRRGEFNEAVAELLGVERDENTAEGVVAGCAVGSFSHLRKQSSRSWAKRSKFAKSSMALTMAASAMKSSSPK